MVCAPHHPVKPPLCADGRVRYVTPACGFFPTSVERVSAGTGARFWFRLQPAGAVFRRAEDGRSEARAWRAPLNGSYCPRTRCAVVVAPELASLRALTCCSRYPSGKLLRVTQGTAPRSLQRSDAVTMFQVNTPATMKRSHQTVTALAKGESKGSTERARTAAAKSRALTRSARTANAGSRERFARLSERVQTPARQVIVHR